MPGERVLGEYSVEGHKPQPLDLAFGQQQPIERITGGRSRVHFREDMRRVDRDHLLAQVAQQLGQVCGGGLNASFPSRALIAISQREATLAQSVASGEVIAARMGALSPSSSR
jgi:hypothetical protein